MRTTEYRVPEAFWNYSAQVMFCSYCFSF